MNRYMMIRRLRGPAFLLLVGALALLNQADILSWGKSWPFFLILAGVIALAERAALAIDGGYPPPPYPGAPYPGAPQPGATDPRTTTGVPTYPGQPTANFPTHSLESGKDPKGGQS
jgi:hypothetical protein